jgi:hypothetical protein
VTVQPSSATISEALPPAAAVSTQFTLCSTLERASPSRTAAMNFGAAGVDLFFRWPFRTTPRVDRGLDAG